MAAPSVLAPYSQPDGRRRAPHVVGEAPRQERQRRTHEECGPDQRQQQDDGGRAEADVQVTEPLVQNVVEQGGADETESGHGELRGREHRQAGPSRHAVGDLSAAETAAAEAGHEGGDDDGRSVDVGA